VSARVLVTGGAGFIGSELTRQLVQAGHHVRVVDNLVNGRRENLAGVLGPRCELVESDVRDAARLDALLADTDVVYHLACLGVRHSLRHPRENHEVNAGATLRLLEASRAKGVARFVNVSSSEVYGTARSVPMDEDHPTEPTTVYGASKLAAECYARAFHRTYGYPTVVVRPFNAYGPRSHHEGDSGEVIPRFLLRSLAGRPMVIFGDGTQTRDFTFVADTARGILAAGFAEAAVGRTINLGTGHEIAIRDLAARVAEVAGRPDTAVIHEAPRPGDVLRLCADARRARAVLGFEPRTGLRDGLSALRNWYASLPESPETLLQREVVRSWEAGEGIDA
jgi:UDP-glucose 4-epimerase